MIRWAVTGPTGAGKSHLTRLLADRGAVVVDGDLLGHEVLAQPEVVSEIAVAFGSEYVTGGVVDRARLGHLVFVDPPSLARLNGLTHGPLSELADRRLDDLERSGDHGLAVFEAAVYFLLPSPPHMDLVVVVDASPEIRRERLVERLGIDAAAAESRVAAQAPMEPFWSRGDVLFDNGGNEDAMERFAERLWSRLDRAGPDA